jgi:deoxyribose-phosphate aldolase
MDLQYRDIAKLIDHALLAPTLTDAQLDEGCALALEYDVASVCILPHGLRRCAQLLAGSTVQPSTTVGFPHGGHTTRSKLAEAEQALADGGTELDMVVNVGKVLSLDYGYVRAEIAALLQLVRGAGKKLKVIFENCYLEQAHQLQLCEICAELEVDWIKTSTGFGSGGATERDLQLMLDNTPPHVQVKASGGIRTLERVLALRELGVSRIGSSSTRAILDELKARLALETAAAQPSQK